MIPSTTYSPPRDLQEYGSVGRGCQFDDCQRHRGGEGRDLGDFCICHLAFGTWCLAFGIWCLAFGVWYLSLDSVIWI